jgi:hypothetical protein
MSVGGMVQGSLVAQCRLCRILAFGQHAAHGIAAGKDPEQAFFPVGHQDGANAPVAHELTGMLYRRPCRQGKRLWSLTISDTCLMVVSGPSRRSLETHVEG